MKLPDFSLLDLRGSVDLPFPYPAQVELLNAASGAQHALMSGFGGPMMTASVYLRQGAGGTDITAGKLLARVPPGVTRFRLGILARGAGEFVAQTAAESPSFVFITIGTVGGLRHQPTWIWGSAASGTGIENRTLRLFASPAETWRTVAVDVGISSSGGEVFGVAMVPVHPAR